MNMCKRPLMMPVGSRFAASQPSGRVRLVIDVECSRDATRITLSCGHVRVFPPHIMARVGAERMCTHPDCQAPEK
jgi:hypothetical protein